MADETGISWADSTFNPWIGCTKVSRGCKNCYAETLVHGRMNRPGTWGPTGKRERTSASNWNKPLTWHRQAEAWEAEHGRPRRVFCASLADVFEPLPELDAWRFDLFELIARTPRLVWMVLTKRPDVAAEWLRAWYEAGGIREWTSRDGIGWGVLPNLWLGTSIEDARYTSRADALREVPAAVRFLSCEPLVGSLFDVRGGEDGSGSTAAAADASSLPLARRALDLTGVDWVIAGGESGGRHAQPMHPQWARELRDACAGDHWCDCLVPAFEGAGQHSPGCRVFRRPAFHMKQWGAWSQAYDDGEVLGASSNDLHYFPDGVVMRYRGSAPTAGGKLLDGADWCEVPDTPALGQLSLA